MKSRKTTPVKRSWKTRKRSVPVLEMAAIMLAVKRLPVPVVTGVWPIGAQVRPALWSERRPDSSTERISARWRRAALLDRRVGLLQPAPYGLVGLLVGAAHRLLRREPPRAQVAPDGVLADRHAELAGDQLGHQRPRPQKPRQRQLVGVLAGHQPRDPQLLRVAQLGMSSAPATPPRVNRAVPTRAVRLDPAPHRLARHAQQPGDLGL